VIFQTNFDEIELKKTVVTSSLLRHRKTSPK